MSRLLCLALTGCIGGGTGLDLPGLAVVYECHRGADTVEVCWPGEVEQLDAELAAHCEPTPRHLGPCRYCCGSGCGAGCNAYQGCFCPEEN